MYGTVLSCNNVLILVRVEIRKAYDVLIDKGSRSHYDQYGVYPSSPINHQEHFLLVR